jgi:hypothetical protein
MRSKFGSSAGLSSSGRMQGIGSDPNYRPGCNDSNSEWDVNQLAEASQKAFSVFASSVSIWSEAVSKVRNSYRLFRFFEFFVDVENSAILGRVL